MCGCVQVGTVDANLLMLAWGCWVESFQAGARVPGIPRARQTAPSSSQALRACRETKCTTNEQALPSVLIASTLYSLPETPNMEHFGSKEYKADPSLLGTFFCIAIPYLPLPR
jgi:hypothetical protein